MGVSQENEREKARQRARALMFKKPVCSDMSFENINTRLMEMQDEAADIDGMLWDDDTLEELLGDEEQAFEFKNAFRDLMSDLDSMREALNSLGDLMYMDDGTRRRHLTCSFRRRAGTAHSCTAMTNM